MRPNLVELFLETEKSHLLPPQIPLRWSRGLLFQRSMHALVAAVLLRLAWLDPFMPDAQSQPQHRELTQSCGCSTGEGSSVVGANRFRQSELTKGGFEYCPSVLTIGAFYRATPQQVPAVGIRNRERIAP
jgi:hypothetical protein